MSNSHKNTAWLLKPAQKKDNSGNENMDLALSTPGTRILTLAFDSAFKHVHPHPRWPPCPRPHAHLQRGACDVAGREARECQLVPVVAMLDEGVGHAHGAELEGAVQQACAGAQGGQGQGRGWVGRGVQWEVGLAVLEPVPWAREGGGAQGRRPPG